MKRSFFPRLSACVMILVVLLFAAVPVWAIPARPDSQYILDEAGVLSEDTIRSLQQRSASLHTQTGAELAVVVTNDTGSDIQNYAEEIYKSWDISNAGILLVLSIQEDDYYAMYGWAVTDYFENDIQDILYEYLEDDFAMGNYDAGLKKVCAQFDTRLRSAIQDLVGSAEQNSTSSAEQKPTSSVEQDDASKIHIPSSVVRIIPAVGVFVFFVTFMLIAIVIAAIVVLVLVVRPRGHSHGTKVPRSTPSFSATQIHSSRSPRTPTPPKEPHPEERSPSQEEPHPQENYYTQKTSRGPSFFDALMGFDGRRRHHGDGNHSTSDMFGGHRPSRGNHPTGGIFDEGHHDDEKPSGGGFFGGGRHDDEKPSGGGFFGGGRHDDEKPSGGGFFGGGRHDDDKPSGGGFFGGSRHDDDKPSGGGFFGGGRPSGGGGRSKGNSFGGGRSGGGAGRSKGGSFGGGRSGGGAGRR